MYFNDLKSNRLFFSPDFVESGLVAVGCLAFFVPSLPKPLFIIFDIQQHMVSTRAASSNADWSVCLMYARKNHRVPDFASVDQASLKLVESIGPRLLIAGEEKHRVACAVQAVILRETGDESQINAGILRVLNLNASFLAKTSMLHPHRQTM